MKKNRIKTIFLFLTFFSLASLCQGQSLKLRDKLIGIWTSDKDSTANATFNIDADSILYVEKLERYGYQLAHDSIKINYNSWMFSGRVAFNKDTLLIIDSEDGDTSKFWKFKN